MRNNLSKKIMQHSRRSELALLSRVLCGALVAIFFTISAPDIARGQRCVTGAIPINQQDSTALVAIHKATNGPNWRYASLQTPWLQGPVRAWAGIGVTQCRVVNLFLGDMNMVGVFPNELGDLTAALAIHINGNTGSNGDLHGPIPETIGKLTNLQSVTFARNNLSGAIPRSFGDLVNLTNLNLGQNKLTGAIPAELGKLINLSLLDLAINQLEGPIPPELGSLANLSSLFLSSNRLSGAIPAKLGNLANVTALTLDNNELSGAIPAELGNLANLFTLFLHNNKLTGAVPLTFVNLTKLQTLFLNDNQLEDLPDLTVMPVLTAVRLQRNRFTFADLEPIVPLLARASVTYFQQDSVETQIDHFKRMLFVNVGGTQTLYQWYENGVLIPGATQPTYAATESRIYRCRTTNPLLPGLVIWSKNAAVKFKKFQIEAKPARDEIRLGGDLTAIKVNILDNVTKQIATEFSGNAVYRILEKLGIKGAAHRLTATTSLIEKGAAQDVFYESTKDSFNVNKPITLKTELSGPAFVEVSVENSTLPPDTVRIELKSPLDFFVERIELQQGIVDIDKEVTLPYKPGETKKFSPLPLVADHHTVLLAHIGYTKKAPIAFSKIEGIAGISAKLHITRGSAVLGIFDSFRFPSRELAPFILKDPKEYDLQEQAGLQDVLAALIPRELVEIPANDYTFDVELEFELGLDEMASDKANNVGVITVPFVATKPLRLLARVAKGNDQENPPEVSPSVWSFLPSAFPLQQSNLQFNDPNNIIYEDTNPSLEKLAQMLAVYNKENVNDQRQRLVIFTTSDEMINRVCRGDAAGCASINGTALISKPNEVILTHELGHTFGLRDTYKTEKWTTHDGEPNPRRIPADPVGNFVERGNIPLADFEQVRQNKIVRAINENGIGVFYEFMGKATIPQSWVDRVSWDHLYRTHFNAGQTNNLLATNAAAGFINITGLADTNNVVTFNPFLVMPKVPEISAVPTGAYALDFTNAAGASLQRFAFNLEFHIPEAGDVSSVPFSYNLPLPDGTKKIAFLKNGRELASRIFSANVPTVQITSPASGQRLGPSTLVTWTASDVDGEALRYDILFSADGQEQHVVAVNLTGTSYLLKRSQVPESGAATLTVVATDGINEGRAVLRNLMVSVDSPKEPTAPSQFILQQNYPNPFNPATTIRFNLPRSMRVEIAIYDLHGQQIRSLLSQSMQPGEHAVAWDGRNDAGELAASGVYFYRLQAGDPSASSGQSLVQSRKMVFMR